MAFAYRQWLKFSGGPFMLGLAVVIVIALLQLASLPSLDRIGLLLFDSYQRAEPRPYEDAPVRIVDIDDETIRRLGQWPWPRTDIGKLTQRLTEAGAAVIAFDIVFAEPDRTSPTMIAERMRRDGEPSSAIATLAELPDHDVTLAKTFTHAPVVLGYFLQHDGRGPTVEPRAGIAIAGSSPPSVVAKYDGTIQSLPRLSAAATGNGFLSLTGDSDSIVRRAPLLAIENGHLVPSLSLDALRVAQGAGSIVVKTSDGSGERGGVPGQVVSLKVGTFEVPTTSDGALWMHYSKIRGDRVIPAWKILTGFMSPDQMKQAFGGRIVFIGTGAIGLRDLVSTPLQDREMGVMIHAQATEQMILGRFLMRPDWAAGLERTLLLVLGLGMALLLPRLGAARGAALCTALITVMLWGSWHAYTRWHYLLDPTYPVIGLVTAYVVETALIYYREERRRAYIHNAFDRYLSPELVKRIADDPGRLELGGEEREMTVLFCDIRGFSSLSEKFSPKEIILFLIGFLTPMCDILLARKATIDKFIGDAILAFWNAPLDDPDQHENAARGALEMVARLEKLNREMRGQQSQPWPGDVRIGIGLNSGLCCVGNMGSAQRLSYSLIGDTVNLTSRIEGLTKYYGVQIAIGSALRDRLPGFAMLELDRVRVVGRDAPETIHVLLGDEKLASTSEFLSLAEQHGQMLTAFRARAWDEVRQLLSVIAPSGPKFGLEKFYALYRERIDALSRNPPGEDWDGVFQAATK
ncbi:MAG: adenylate/guanylate cyclase domain-containing protein [Alphaproteobacteria bacterium]|nr:adenylate/guanylate cyclase domain-containing protein [Alphaproteobacteria bacterium]